jgi:hypothetical protein
MKHSNSTMATTKTLRERILESRISTIDSQFFICASSLQQSISTDDIRAALGEQQYERHRRKEIIQRSLNGGIKVFAILLVLRQLPLLVNFIDHDHLQSAYLDSKLPFDRETLSRIIPDCFEEFFKLQWEFCAPVFGGRRFHRIFEEHTVMPFVGETLVKRSNFGNIFKTATLSSHIRHLKEGNTQDACEVSIPVKV